jgi:hypothetical protein
LEHVLTLKVRLVGNDLLDPVAGRELADNHSPRDSHAAKAGFSSHHLGALGYAIEFVHGTISD